jgi:hypothetical protein
MDLGRAAIDAIKVRPVDTPAGLGMVNGPALPFVGSASLLPLD